MSLVAGYGRVSTHGQVDGTSPEEQKKSIERACHCRDSELVEFYSDDAFSGSDDKRPGLQRLLHDSRAGKFNTVMFTKLDRLGRNVRDIKNILHDLTSNGLKYYCIEQPEINNEGTYGSLLLNILGAFAEFESQMITERTTAGRTARWKEGNGAIGSLPLGYIRKKDDKKHKHGKLCIDEQGREIYLRIVSMYLDQNYSLRDIAIKLTNEGIPSPSGRSLRWHNVTVGDILRNPAYTGEAVQNKHKYVRKKGNWKSNIIVYLTKRSPKINGLR